MNEKEKGQKESIESGFEDNLKTYHPLATLHVLEAFFGLEIVDFSTGSLSGNKAKKFQTGSSGS